MFFIYLLIVFFAFLILFSIDAIMNKVEGLENNQLKKINKDNIKLDKIKLDDKIPINNDISRINQPIINPTNTLTPTNIADAMNSSRPTNIADAMNSSRPVNIIKPITPINASNETNDCLILAQKNNKNIDYLKVKADEMSGLQSQLNSMQQSIQNVQTQVDTLVQQQIDYANEYKNLEELLKM